MVGVHILFPNEIEDAAKLVNSNGGDWGYVTIPIQANDKDLVKWQKFMDDAKRLHIIPIIRLATEPDPNNTNVWRIPNPYDIVDFANFLNSLDWPTENRYVIIFNEVNRYDEWGGQPPDPATYADLLSYAVDAFKVRNGNFFVISAGLDNAAPNDGVKYIGNFQYLEAMQEHNADVFQKIDGIGSHSYPNPGFIQPPTSQAAMSIDTYNYEYDLINAGNTQKKPIFITETGWDASTLGNTTTAQYYKDAFENVWGADRDKIVAVTPFLLDAGAGPFDKFSFLQNGQPSKFYTAVAQVPKTKGDPVLEKDATSTVLAAHTQTPVYLSSDIVPINSYDTTMPPFLKLYFKALLGL